MGLIAGLIAKALMPGRDPVEHSSRHCWESWAPSLGASSVRRLVMDGLLIQWVS